MRMGNVFVQFGYYVIYLRGEFGCWECDFSLGDFW